MRKRHERLCRLSSPLQTSHNSACVATGTVYQVNEPLRGFTKETLVYQVKALFLTHLSIGFHKEPLSSANNLSKQFVFLLGSFSLQASWGAVLNCSWKPQTGPCGRGRCERWATSS